jgi:hypothetical protein
LTRTMAGSLNRGVWGSGFRIKNLIEKSMKKFRIRCEASALIEDEERVEYAR